MAVNRDTERIKVFNRRATLLGGAQAVLLSGLLGRMHYLQVVESDRYSVLAEENRINLRLLPPTRGRILDRFGEPLAINRQNFRMLVIPEQVRDINVTIDVLSEIIDLSNLDRDRINREVNRRRGFVPVTIRENLDWQEMARVQVNAVDLPGVIVDEGLTRFYPQIETAAHILGYVSSVDEDDINGDPLLQLPGFRIGKAGVEKKHDNFLRGSPGTSQYEVNAMGRSIRELERKESEPGLDLFLTLDERLQNFASKRMGKESASCVVMDVLTGEILVMASVPGFDPNAFNRGLTQEEWNGLLSDPRAPMTNKAISGQYSPGSTFKMVVALAALENAAISSDQKFNCEGFTELGRRRFHCWEEDGHGKLSMIQAIAQSCDIYFYELASRIGVDRIADMARRLGLGSLTGVNLLNERAGLVPTSSWKKENFPEPWQQGETYITGIGQGYLLATPLQLAVMTARLATGLAVKPTLAKKLPSNESSSNEAFLGFEPLNLNESNLSFVREGMFEVLNGPRGTARASKLSFNGSLMSGKTGTTQVKGITLAEREEGLPDIEDIPWNERSHALFVAYAPHESPRYALSLVVEHGGGGSSVAAPISKDIMKEVLKYDPSRKPRISNLPENITYYRGTGL